MSVGCKSLDELGENSSAETRRFNEAPHAYGLVNMQIQQSFHRLNQLSCDLVAELLRLEDYGYPFPRSIFVCGAGELTELATEAIKQELVSRKGFKATVRSACELPLITGGEYCIDIGYFFRLPLRDPVP